jgi:hypothetical protein
MSQPPKRPKPTRSVCLVRDAAADGVGVFRVTVGEDATYYTVREVPCEIGGRGFAVHKLGLGSLYHVRVGQPADCSCECLGYLRHGYCKHLLGLMALVDAGRV